MDTECSRPSTVERPTTAPFRWDRLTLAAALGYCLLVAALSVGAILPELRSEFQLNGMLAAAHGSTFGVGLLIMGRYGVALVDRLGRAASLRVAAAGLLVGVSLLAAGPVWPITLLGTATSGLGGALLVMIMPGLISDHHGPNRAEAFAAANGAPGLAGVAFSLLVGAAIALGWSWRVPYLGLTLAVAVALTVVARPVVLPEAARHGHFRLAVLRNRDVRTPYLHIVNAVLTEFTVAVWAAVYLREVGGASPGLAPALAGLFGISMFGVRMVMAPLQRLFGSSLISVGFLVLGSGATLMALAPNLWVMAAGLVLVGVGGGPLYPLTVDRLYHRAEPHVDAVGLGAIAALASGTAVMLGPLVLGVVSDVVELRWAILLVTSLAIVGAITQRPRH